MTGFASAQAAFEAPPGDGPDPVDCPECSHVTDITSECGQCDGTGDVDPRDLPSWCDRCGMTGACPDCDPREQGNDR